MRYGLSEQQLQEITQFIAAYAEVEEAILFGSRAIDTFKEASDVDIALKGNDVTAALAARLKFDIEEDTDLPFFFDFVAYPTITNEALRKHIDRKGVLIYPKVEGEEEASDWKKTSTDRLIAEGLLKIGDGYRAKNSELSTEGLPFARAGNVNNGFKFSGADYLPLDYLKIVGDKVSTIGDTVFTSKGTVGRFGFVSERTPQFVFSPQLCYWRSLNHAALAPHFIYYWMHSREFFEQVEGLKGQTDMADYVSLADQRRIAITIPPLPVQKAIASILSSLDDRIDLLHRQNKTLEAIAETLFRQWFIEEADDDWEDGTLGDVLELAYGKALKQDTRTGFGYPVVGSSGIVGYHSECLVHGPGIVIGRKGTLGKVIYLFESFFPIDTTYYIRPKAASYGLFYEYFLLKKLSFENSDSAVPGLNRDIALSEEIKLVPQNKVKSFNERCMSIFEKLKINASQICTLEKLRDILLPKLMSGEVRVKSD